MNIRYIIDALTGWMKRGLTEAELEEREAASAPTEILQSYKIIWDNGAEQSGYIRGDEEKGYLRSPVYGRRNRDKIAQRVNRIDDA